MPVGLDRFIRVMSGGLVVTDKLVQVRTEKTNAAIKQLDERIKEVKLTGMACPQLDKALADLNRDRDAALKLKGNREKCEALEPIKERARAAAAQAVDVIASAKQAVQLTDDAIKAIKALQDEAANLKKLGFDTAQMDDEFNGLVELRADSAKLTDIPARIKTETALKQQADEAVARAKALSKAAADAGATDKAKPDATKKSKIYEAALKKLYGIEIEVPEGMTNTHFDKVFDMFGRVPKEHVAKEGLKKLAYDVKPIGGVFYGGNVKKIEMGNFGDATGTEDYQYGDQVIPANSFNVTTLHEIGHAVDAKANVMGSHMDTSGCGGWIQETTDSVATAFAAERTKASALSKKLKAEDLKKAVVAAVKDGKTDKPAEIEEDDWKKIEPWLKTKALPAREAAQPFFSATQIIAGGRAYTCSDDASQDWYSYPPAERTANGVNLYQWRSPAEWFAEIYAISWLAKKPPKGVAADIAKHMWSGKPA